MRRHSGERPFACDALGCGYTCAQGGHLMRHMRTHTGERPFACDALGCGYTCSESRNLTEHMRTHTGERAGLRIHEHDERQS